MDIFVRFVHVLSVVFNGETCRIIRILRNLFFMIFCDISFPSDHPDATGYKELQLNHLKRKCLNVFSVTWCLHFIVAIH